MTEDTRQLGLVLDQPERAARDVHDAARGSERVDAVRIEHDELPVQLRTRAGLRKDIADERHIPGDVLVLIDAEFLPELRADLLAELPLVGVRHLQIGNLVDLRLCVLGLFQPAAEAAELRVRGRRADRRKRDHQSDGCFHMTCPTSWIGGGTTIWKIPTGRVFPLTTTSPSGRMS